MSLPLGEIRYNILRAGRRTHSSSIADEVGKWINQEYFEICRQHSWHKLRRTLELDFSTLDSEDENGLALPANLLGIDRVRDESNNIEFLRRDEADSVQSDERFWRYSTKAIRDVPVWRFATVSVTEATPGIEVTKGTIPTGLTLPAAEDIEDQWVQFGTDPAFYLLSNLVDGGPTFTVDLDSPYRGGTAIDATMVLGPVSAENLLIRDNTEDILRDRKVDVFYWEAPQMLHFDDDMCILPLSRLLEIQVLIKMLGTIGKRQIATDRYRGEYDDVLQESKRLNPDYPRRSIPRGATNRLFGDTTNIFGNRNNQTADELRYIFRRKSQ